MSDAERQAKHRFEEFVLNDPWARFVVEVYYLREYYVQEALIKQAKGTGYPDYFDIKVYENEFLSQLESKFGLKGT